MILTIYDLSGIQSYIFATNKLKEMIGASFIVNEALFKNIPVLFKEKNDAWEKEAQNGEFSFNDNDKKKIVYIGGGNALVMYKNEKIEKEYTRNLQKMIFGQAGGALKLCSASINVELNDTKKLAEIQKDLMLCLDNQKRITPNVSTAKGFSINAHDNINFETVLLFNDEFATKNKYFKTEMYSNKKKQERGFNIFEGLEIGDINITDDFDAFQKENKKNYLAVIHIDGNTMGIKIREFVQEQNCSLIESLGKLGKLSFEINKTYRAVLSKTVKEIYKNDSGTIPFRPIIVDGDDVTVICAAENAFDFVKIFMDNLNENTINSLGENDKLTAAAGIAFVNIGFPFYTAYDIAEQCCKNAKNITRKRGFDGEEKDNKNSMDFQICYSGVTNSVSEFRDSNYIFKRNENEKKSVYKLNIRPYIFGEDIKEIYGYENGFDETKKNIIGKIARSKLKGLRNEYGKGILAAETYGDFLLARATDEDEETQKTAELLSKPFFPDLPDCDEYYAKFFDVLDILDFIETEKESGVETDE